MTGQASLVETTPPLSLEVVRDPHPCKHLRGCGSIGCEIVGSRMEVEGRWKWKCDGSGRSMEVEARL